jgi:hypothetical protein
MKKADLVLGILWSLAVLGLGGWLLAERSVCLQLAQENAALRQKSMAMEGLNAENQRLSNWVARAVLLPSRTNHPLEAPQLADADTDELLRLRAKLDLLRQQTNEMGTLREDTQKLRAALENKLKNQSAGTRSPPAERTTANGSQFEILKAEYWTDHERMDVTEELQDRIRADSLKAVASNNLKGDPEFGQVKHLTIEYRIGGVTMTNEFREGDVIVLPRNRNYGR